MDYSRRVPHWIHGTLLGIALFAAVGCGGGAADPATSVAVVSSDTMSIQEDTPSLFDVLANDQGALNAGGEITAVGSPAHGSASIISGQIRYTPDTDYHGTDSFTYTVTLDDASTASANVSISIISVNDAPAAQIDTASVTAGASVLINVLANDSDADGDSLAIAGVSGASHGTATIESGQVRYTADSGYDGTDTLTYTASDGTLTTNATITVTISTGTPANTAPTANPDTASVAEDGSVDIAPVANDTDPEGDTVSLDGNTTPAHGTLVISGSTFTYTPDADYNGADSFIYTITDGSLTDTATVTITVTAVNDAPIATNDSAETGEDASILINVAANDTDIDGDTLSIANFTQGSSGSVAEESGSLRYTPGAEYSGADSFTYTITDGTETDTATVTVTVNAVNDAPAANADSATVDEDGTTLIDVLVNDTDPESDAVSITGFTQGTDGTVSQEGNSLRYTPDSDFNGSDSFTYDIGDGNGGTDTATVNITVNAVNDLPVANDDNATVSEDASVDIYVYLNDTDPDGDTIQLSAKSNGAHGTVFPTANYLTYTPAANYNGSDSFQYFINDGNGGTDSASVTVTITAVNDDPVAGDDTGKVVDEDGTTLISVLANDSDIDGDTVSITGFTQGTDGTVTQEGSSLRYTPDSDFSGSDSFTYDIGDGNGGTDTGTVSITVNAVNDLPVANDDSVSLDEDTTVLIDVLANDTDIDGDTLSIAGFIHGVVGTVTQEGSELRYAPISDYSGADSFTYDISDGNGGTDTATVNITVTAVNDAPNAVDDSASLNENSTVLINVLANDSDPESDTISITGFTQGANGTVTQEGGQLRYTPDASYVGTDSFTYDIEDANGNAATGNVSVEVFSSAI